ncbi:hypothetical protein GGI20_003936 [Coemansia sp. BCRC 34301]|nr:hypothetical protein GGI20_003936 [Coemansia sp. BCRC 34301]
MLSRVLVPFSRVAIIMRTSGIGMRGFGASALACKVSGGVSRKPAGAKKAVKAKKPVKANKPVKAKKPAKAKKVAAKPKREASKKAVPKKELREKALNSSRPIVTLPKGAPSAYSLYVRDAWKTAKKGDLPQGAGHAAVFSTMSRSSASAWKALSDAAKQQYQAQHDSARAAHDQAVRKWWAGADLDQVNLENQRRRRHNRRVAKGVIKGARLPMLKDPLAPKRPGSAFALFLKEHVTGGGGSITEACKTSAAQWKALSDDAKAPYVAAAQAQASAYKAALQKYAMHHAH